MSRGEYLDEYRDPALGRRLMIHGPGCPVCFTPLETLDRARAIAERPEVACTGFGEMLRGSGSPTGLLSLRAPGADVRLPLSELRLLRRSPGKAARAAETPVATGDTPATPARSRA
ncbi:MULTISPECIES: HypD family hydrogenase formation protein [Streptomyces]|uniref:hypothetical protein n=1 Tax=Streptomyces TaxID=1883 RepID=UPI00358DEF8B